MAKLSSIDPNSGFCSKTKIFHSLRPTDTLPPQTIPLSLTDYVFSLIPPETTAGIINATTGHRISYSEFIYRTQTLAAYLQNRIGLSKGDSAFILSPNSLHVPILYFSLLSIGVIVSPSNPMITKSEISRQIQLCKPVIAFVTSENMKKVPVLRHRSVILDSPEFASMMKIPTGEFRRIDVFQSDPAAILYSSGTIGGIKGVVLSHRNWISVVAGNVVSRTVRKSPAVLMCTAPFFHSYGFGVVVRSVALGETLVCMERFEMQLMLRGIQEFKVTMVAVAPPIVVAMARGGYLVERYDLSSLEVVSSGGAPLQEAVIERFEKRFPRVQVAQAYGMTEASGGVTRSMGPKESQVLGASGRLIGNCEAKIVDLDTGTALSPFKKGELWVRGPSIMKGYVGDEEATMATLDSEGWLQTGDLCYFDDKGFLFFVDRIKELIKYKGYQIAPTDLEYLLQSHPDIIEATVIPYPDEEAGQVPMAFVVRRLGSTIDETQIKDFIAKQVSPYKKIRRVSFINSIPKSMTGKVLRKELIKLALQNTSSKL